MQNKWGVSRMSKFVIALQTMVIVGVFAFAFFFAPSLEYPNDGEVLERRDIEFRFRNANVILVDDNEDFSSPKEVNLDDLNVTRLLFEPGTYYWKAIGLVESGARSFTIGSNVGLELDEDNETLKNVGDTTLNVSVKDSAGLSGLVILDVDIEYPVNISEEKEYRGSEYEE